MSIYLSFTPVKSQKECCPKDPKIPKTKNTSLPIESKQDTRCLPLNSSQPFKLILFFFQHFHKPQLLLFLAFLPDRLSELFPFLPPLIQVYLWACFIFESCDIITQTWAIATHVCIFSCAMLCGPRNAFMFAKVFSIAFNTATLQTNPSTLESIVPRQLWSWFWRCTKRTTNT